MKSLTKSQIQELFDFTKSHRVRYYDLQSEVVDHLASAIETKWVATPDLPFQKALEEIYTSFGIYGFGKLEQEKREAIQWKIVWKVWAFVKSYLTVPKIGLTLLLTVGIVQILQLLEKPYLMSACLVYFFLFCFFMVVYYNRWKEKELMTNYLELNAVVTGEFPVLFLNVLMVDVFLLGGNPSPLALIGLSFWIVISILTTIGAYQYLLETIAEVKLRYSE